MEASFLFSFSSLSFKKGSLVSSNSNGASLLKVDGLKIPYISDENADEDPELNDEGPVGKRMKDTMLSMGNP
ncbi:hypothetical protein LR48_Vigan743s000700 [Vigna angularis]|uniref:Uncharacterized protein n=1 Tax=Phaseolus angularis TaxID=3914 RepID=A0A0L9THP0_PHAAN|nr:hypothetical protein LR48_Vigan743s000700 [Vigna angularis]